LGETELNELLTAITAFHTSLGYDVAALNDSVTMLLRIEGMMEEMMRRLSKVDLRLLKEKIYMKEIERQNQERTEKNIRDKKEQEEKTQRAIQNAMMSVKRRTRRPLVARMVPQKKESRKKREEAMRQKLAQAVADEDLLFGEICD
jgi:alpha-galactosidase/6-phospho-beta-glucosidase family protein